MIGVSRIRLALFAALCAIWQSCPALAQSAPKELVEARAAFAKALAAKDLAALTNLTHFPLKNAVYREPDSIPRAKFASQAETYWREAKCLKSQPLKRAAKDEKDRGEWLVACDEGINIFYFGLFEGRWLHSAFENVGE